MKLAMKVKTADSRIGSQRKCRTVMGISRVLVEVEREAGERRALKNFCPRSLT
jgi:hypothetical protein